MTDRPERRAHERQQAEIAVSVRGEGLPTLVGETHDFSHGGFFLRCGGPHQVGDLCDVEFYPGGHGSLPAVTARAQVVRVVPEGVGFRFLEASAEAVQTLERLFGPNAPDRPGPA